MYNFLFFYFFGSTISYQFIACVKTAVINNSSSNNSSKNCEDNDFSLLINLKGRLQCKNKNAGVSDLNEFSGINNIEVNMHLNQKLQHMFADSFTKNYKLIANNAITCLKVKAWSFHSFVYFKEVETADPKLNYCNINTVKCVIHANNLLKPCITICK